MENTTRVPDNTGNAVLLARKRAKRDYHALHSKKPVVFVFFLSLVWAYAVVQSGGVVGLDRKIFLLILGVLGLFWCLFCRKTQLPLPFPANWCWWLLPAYAALQLVPIPRLILAALSPARAEIDRALDTVAAGRSMAPLSVAPAIGINHLLLLAGYGIVFFLAFQLASNQEFSWFLVFPPVFIAVLEAVLGIVQALNGEAATGTYVNRDHFAGLLEMALPFAVAFPLARWKTVDTRRDFPMRLAALMCAGWAAAAVIVIGSMTSLSRAGVIAPLFALFVMGIVTWRGNGWRSAVAIAVLTIGLAACFVFLPSDALIARFAQSSEDLSAEGRTMLWKESLALVKAFPLFGCGLGGYESAFLRYKVSAPMVSDDHVHNDYLQFLIELGVIGFLIGAVLMWAVVSRAWRAARSQDPRDRFLAIACIGSFAAIGLHSFVDFNLYIPANAMLLSWLSGVALALGQGDEKVMDLRHLGLGTTLEVKSEERRDVFETY